MFRIGGKNNCVLFPVAHCPNATHLLKDLFQKYLRTKKGLYKDFFLPDTIFLSKRYPEKNYLCIDPTGETT